MPYQVAPLFCRPWTLNGMSAKLIESHYEHDYGGAVQRLNAVAAEIATFEENGMTPSAMHRLKRDELELLNSTLLHELYFASIGGDGRAIPAPMQEVLTRDFGSTTRWRAQFVAMAGGLAGRSGWVLLSYVPRDARLVNHTSAEHSPAIVGAIPLLALDMFEHAYHQEFGANFDAYVAAFMRNIEWDGVSSRYTEALQAPQPKRLEQKQFAEIPSMSVEDVRSMLDTDAPVHVIDVRPRHYVTRSHEIVEGAVWRDPERIDEWIGELPTDQPVVTFCVYGFHVGCETAGALRKAGIDARYMAGGHFAWKAMNGPTRLLDGAHDSAKD